MKHLKLWILLIILVVGIAAGILFGRDWIHIGKKWDVGGDDFDFGVHWNKVKYRHDMYEFKKWLGMDIEEPAKE